MRSDVFGLIFFCAAVLCAIYYRVAAERQREEMLASAASRQPALAGKPLLCEPWELPHQDRFGLFDIETGEGLGNIHRTLLAQLIAFHTECGLAANDFLLMPESLDVIGNGFGYSGLAAFLKPIFEERGELEVRWSTVLAS